MIVLLQPMEDALRPMVIPTTLSVTTCAIGRLRLLSKDKGPLCPLVIGVYRVRVDMLQDPIYLSKKTM